MRIRFTGAFFWLLLVWHPANAVGPVKAVLPHVFSDGDAVGHGRSIVVGVDGDFQQALDESRPGQTIVLQAGAVYEGSFTLPQREGSAWTVVRTSAMDRLSTSGHRVSVDQAQFMPKLESSEGPVIDAGPGARNYLFLGIEVTSATGTGLMDRWFGAPSHGPVNLVVVGGDANQGYASHITFDRCYLHGDAKEGTRRGIAMNGRYIAVIDSVLVDFMQPYADAQAIEGWDGPGPYLIDNNLLEASGEDIMFGGADPATRGLVPADIVITHNHFDKPLRWKPKTGEKPQWSIKNLLELKNARRVLIQGNVFEHNWPGSQSGFAILFTVRNQDGGAPWSTVEDVTFTDNVVRHVADGINILGSDDIHKSRPTRRVTIDNNLFYDIGGKWGSGRFLQLLNGVQDVSVSHNTVLGAGDLVKAGETRRHRRFLFTANVVSYRQYGVVGTGTRPGADTIARYFDDSRFSDNLLVDPPGDDFPGSIRVVQTAARVDTSRGERADFRFVHSGSNAYAGVDFAALCKAQGDAAAALTFCATDSEEK